jgi:hypothetical protein
MDVDSDIFKPDLAQTVSEILNLKQNCDFTARMTIQFQPLKYILCRFANTLFLQTGIYPKTFMSLRTRLKNVAGNRLLVNAKTRPGVYRG